MANKIQIRRGTGTVGTLLDSGELAFKTDTKAFHIGTGVGSAAERVSLWDEYSANSILAAVTADTPAPVTFAASTIFGRKATGNVGPVTMAELWAILSGAPGADVSMNTKKITSLADGTDNGDAVNKGQLDAVAGSAEAMVFKGTVGSGGTHTIINFNALATYTVGWTYKAVEAGTIKGKVCEIGDMLIAIVGRTGSGQVDADWAAVQANLDGAVIGPASVTADRIAVFSGVTGKLIKDGGVLVSGLATSAHVHGAVTNDGKIGSTAGLMIKTGAGGALEALTAGTSGQFLAHDGTFQTPAGTVGANTALSNLASVAINQALVPGTAGALDFGSTAKPWKDIILGGASATPSTNQFKITGASTGGLRTLTLPDLSGTVLTDNSTIDGGTLAA